MSQQSFLLATAPTKYPQPSAPPYPLARPDPTGVSGPFTPRLGSPSRPILSGWVVARQLNSRHSIYLTSRASSAFAMPLCPFATTLPHPQSPPTDRKASAIQCVRRKKSSRTITSCSYSHGVIGHLSLPRIETSALQVLRSLPIHNLLRDVGTKKARRG